MSGASAPITFPVSTPGAEQAKRALEGVALSASKADIAYRKMAENSSRVSASLGALGRAAAGVSPEMGVLGESVGRAAGSIMQMTGVLGGGIAGIAVGGVIALLGLYSDAAEKAAAATKKLSDEQEKQAKKSQEQWDAAKKLADQILNTDPAAGIQAQINAQMAELSAFQKTHQGAISADERRMQASIDKLKRSAIDARQAAEDAKKLGYISDREDLTGKDIGPGKNEFEREMALADAAQKSLSIQQSFDKMRLDQLQGLLRTQAEYVKLASQNESAFKKQALDDEMSAMRQHESEIVDMAKARDRELAQLDAQAQKRHNETRAIGISAYQGIGTVGIQAVQRLVKGQQVSLKELIGGIGDYMVADGTRWMWQGIASLNPVQAGLGGLEIAAGLAMGAATSGGGGGGSGGAGGSGGGQRYWDGSKSVAGSPISPAVAPSAVSGAPVTIYMQSLLTPTADDGVRVQRAYQEAQRQGRL